MLFISNFEEFLCKFFYLSVVIFAFVAAIVKLLRGPLSGNAIIAGLSAIGNLIDKNEDNRKLFATVGACDGK